MKITVFVTMIWTCLSMTGATLSEPASAQIARAQGSPAVAEPSRQRGENLTHAELAGMPVEALLRSLTFEDFALREAVVRELAGRDWIAAAELARIAQDESTRLHLRARYMIRRCFWELAPKVASQLKAEDARSKAKAKKVFRFLVEIFPLDEHHHGGLQKLAVVLEKLGHHDLALEA